MRSYLSSNCSHCHQPGGPGLGNWDARISISLGDAGIINGILRDNKGDVDQRVIVPGDLLHSEMYQRMTTLGNEHMPPLGTDIVDEEIKSLLAEWILNMSPEDEVFSSYQEQFLSGLPIEEQARDADPDNDELSNYQEFVAKNFPPSVNNSFEVTISRIQDFAKVTVDTIPNRGIVVEKTSSLDEPITWETYEVISWFEEKGAEYELDIPLSSQEESSYFRTIIVAP